MMKQTGKGRAKLQHPWKNLFWMPLLTVLLSLGVAKLILWGKIGEENIELASYGIAALVALLGSFAAAKKTPRKSFLWGLLIAVLYASMLLLGNLLFFGVTYGGIRGIILAVFVGGAGGSILANLKKGKIA